MPRRAPSFHATALGLLLLGLAGTVGSACATGVGGEDDDDSGPSSGAGANSGTFTLAAPIDVMTAPPGYTIPLSFDHGTLVSEGKSLSNGDDIRVEFDDGSGPVEIDRILDDESAWDTIETTIFFQVQPTAGTYRLKYGNPLATDPPANGANVFIYYDSFNGGVVDEGWVATAIDTDPDPMEPPVVRANPAMVCPPDCGLQQAEGTLRFAGDTGAGNFGDEDASGFDHVAFLHREVSGDFVFEVKLSSVSGNLTNTSRVGGVMVRASLEPDAVFGAVVRNPIDGQQQVLARSGTMVPVDAQGAGDQNMLPAFFRAQRFAGSVSFAVSSNTRLWTNVGAGVLLPDDPAHVGIPFANTGSGQVQSVDVDWVRVRLGFDSEPLAQLGAETDL